MCQKLKKSMHGLQVLLQKRNADIRTRDGHPRRRQYPPPPLRRAGDKNWRTFILNCQSLRGKVKAFQSSVDYFQPDCILGTKSWLDKSVSTNEIFPPGYKIFGGDRITSTQGKCLSLSKKIMTYLSSPILIQTRNFYGRKSTLKI